MLELDLLSFIDRDNDEVYTFKTGDTSAALEVFTLLSDFFRDCLDSLEEDVNEEDEDGELKDLVDSLSVTYYEASLGDPQAAYDFLLLMAGEESMKRQWEPFYGLMLFGENITGENTY